MRGADDSTPHCAPSAERDKPRERNGFGGGVSRRDQCTSISFLLSPACPVARFSSGGEGRSAQLCFALPRGIRVLPSGSSASAGRWKERGLLFGFPFGAPGKVRSSSSVLGPLILLPDTSGDWVRREGESLGFWGFNWGLCSFLLIDCNSDSWFVVAACSQDAELSCSVPEVILGRPLGSGLQVSVRPWR
jgi:hypothetical protein